MTSKSQKSARPGYGKPLDAWQAPPDAGQPVGCLATSFTFSPVFFEEECLGRFLALQTTPHQDGALYLVEREEKLAQVQCAAALVDQNHCRGARSLRWDLLPIRPDRGVLHAKVSLLHWTNWIRLVVASANLTEDGYRRNREIFGVVDYCSGAEVELGCLLDVVEFLREIVAVANPDTTDFGPAQQRCLSFLDNVLAAAEEMEGELRPPRRGHVTVKALLVGPGRPSLFDQVSELWRGRTPPPWADVVSPFFDPPESENAPAKRLWDTLKQRGEANVRYYVTAEPVPGEENAVFVHAPQSLLTAQPSGRSAVSTDFYRVETVPSRPLHAKGMWFEDERFAACLVGSSNFTTPGLGIGETVNYEANLVYWVDFSRDPKGYRQLQQGFPAGEPIDLKKVRVRWQPRTDTEEDSPPQELLTLPRAFGSAVFRTDDKGNAFVRLCLAESPPAGWRVCREDGHQVLLSEEQWQAQGCPRQIELAWPDSLPPDGFEVRWAGSGGCAWWPVNVEDSKSLPPPAELRNLSLDQLVRILTSASPLHVALRRELERKGSKPNGSGPEPPVDPHKKVDTSTFLLQRTRRVSWALAALRDRLSQPVATEQALAWRLNGPVGVRALKDALVNEAKTDEEKVFLLTELALELSRVRPQECSGCLAAAQVRRQIRELIRELHEEVMRNSALSLSTMQQYVEEAFQEALR